MRLITAPDGKRIDGVEVEDDDGEMRPEAGDALLWETAVIES